MPHCVAGSLLLDVPSNTGNTMTQDHIPEDLNPKHLDGTLN
jgi:hypothetical protein